MSGAFNGTVEDAIASAAYKFCSRCKETRPIFDFSLATGEKDGHQTWCRQCQREYRHVKQKEFMLRQCNMCRKSKPPEEFNRDSTKSGGRKHTCRSCEKTQREKRRLAKMESGIMYSSNSVSAPVQARVIDLRRDSMFAVLDLAMQMTSAQRSALLTMVEMIEELPEETYGVFVRMFKAIDGVK